MDFYDWKALLDKYSQPNFEPNFEEVLTKAPRNGRSGKTPPISEQVRVRVRLTRSGSGSGQVWGHTPEQRVAASTL